jgi:UPF0716 protein FxsA
MLFRIFLVFIGGLTLDLWSLIAVGRQFGLGWTLLLVLGTGVLGLGLVKSQGFFLWRQTRLELSRGRMPTHELINGVVVLLGAVFLISPGFLGDAVGFMMVIPFTRPYVVWLLGHWLRKKYRDDLFIKLISKGRGRILR